MIVNELASAIYADVVAGLVGVVSNPTISMEQLEQDVVDERLALIKQYSIKNLLPKKDLLISINCIPVDCESLDKCCDTMGDYSSKSKPIAHFEIPQLVNDFGEDAIEFIGSTNKEVAFKVYTSRAYRHHKYRLRNANRPYVFIDTTPNASNMYDGYIFNAPLLKRLTVIGIFKDLRQVEDFSCCIQDLKNFTFLDAEIKYNLTQKKLRHYRANYQGPQPNNQIPK